MSRCWQQSLQGWLLWGDARLPYARHRWFQLAPAELPQGTDEPLSQDGGSMEKMYLGKGKKCCLPVKSEEKWEKWELSIHQGERRRRDRRAPGTEAEIALQPLEKTTPEQFYQHIRNKEVKLSLKRGWRKSCFISWFCFVSYNRGVFYLTVN